MCDVHQIDHVRASKYCAVNAGIPAAISSIPTFGEHDHT